ncbi:16S rRNA (guanine(527)-N(7))-methyltransferase RsmG [Bremerella sp. T1]|uniref:16S rRNA (guanine(527)-N(7))-methyltransferase RsmG n=1 Tax=Bremerella sp. TYQ1 TaxID=3119568 RepID=UPI001CCCD6E7|nr:16S rRNA (guanine(527)-N(7))-methyltransferase RsmG [Bremerella volcania]UBM36863.1 16S rRNA (guanine(527)-N(7))-methyltransferase RsmG [Bremerella volcania]
MSEEGSPSATLEDALQKYGAPLPPEIRDQVQKYVDALWEINKTMNLTRHTDYDKFVSRDVIDSLAIAGQLKPNEEILDMGSGGGVPGILIAILRPDVRVTLCDSVGKKAHAMQAIVEQVELEVPVYHNRAEQVLEDLSFDAVVCRAVAPMRKLLLWLDDHWLAAGRLLTIKGGRWVEEVKEARHHGYTKGVEIRNVHEYETPGNDHPSVILKVWPKGRKEP